MNLELAAKLSTFLKRRTSIWLSCNRYLVGSG